MSIRFVSAAPLLLMSVAAAAQSSVSAYGIFDVTVREERNQVKGVSSSKASVGDGAFTGSRLGFRGTEDLGGGYSAGFGLEAGFDPSSGAFQQANATADYGQAAAPSGRAFGREAKVFLGSPMGTVSFGRQYTLAHEISSRFQPLGNPNLPSLSLFSVHHIARQDGMVVYKKSFGGLEVSASKTLGGVGGNAGASSGWGAGATYASDRWFVGGYHQDMNNITNAETRKISGFGGAFDLLPATRLFAGWMQRTHRVSAQRNRAWEVGVNHSLLPQLVATVSYTSDRQTGSAALAGSRTVALVQLDYLLSKRSDVYVEVDRNVVKGGYTAPASMPGVGNQTGAMIGVRHRF